MNKNRTFKLDIDVRFRDLDALGHVNNAVYFTYFEEGRKSFFDNLYPERDLYDFRFILAHIRCDFIKQATLKDHLTLHMTVGDIGRKSFKLYYELTDRNDYELVFAKAESVQVCYDYKSNETVRVSDELKQQLLNYKDK
ncbi:MAG TPA: acyl-CoA thioesterase [Deltaproteobacteria bacterium]|nr:acyl-CoA thioesterase [Deltaproteobacteria bacterium]